MGSTTPPTPSRLGPCLAALACLLLTPVAPALAAAPGAQAPSGPRAVVQATQRVALVVGNNAYRDAPLLNPVNDARAMARALEKAGFTVMLRTDATQRELLESLREFGNRLQRGGTGVFYFAGHGMQIKGRNYLVPVGADIQREDEVAYQSLDAQAVLDKMESAGNGANLVILDACRNNPFARSFRSASQGLAQMEAPVGTLVAFATAPGSVASDGQGSHGLYTHHLLQAIAQPGLKVEDVFKQVRVAVRRESQGRQVPWESTSLEGDLYITEPPAVVAAPPPPPPAPDPLQALDDALWATVRESTVPAELQAYLRRFPEGRHAAAARAGLEALTRPTLALAAPPPAPGPAPAVAAAPAALAAAAAALPSLAPLGPALREPEPAPPPPPPPAPAAASPVAAPAPENPMLELVRWGARNLAPRPADARVNTEGFAVGDRWRWVLIDRLAGGRVQRDEVWRIDEVRDDGELVLNEGRVRLAPNGVLRESITHNVAWSEWTEPLDLTPRGLPVGGQRPLTAQRRMRDETGLVQDTRYTGRLRVLARETLELPAGRFDTLRVEATLQTSTQRSDGESRSGMLTRTAWYAPELGLFVAYEQELRASTQLLLERQRFQLQAVDLLRSTRALAAAGR
jgi:hypothetical protein